MSMDGSIPVSANVSGWRALILIDLRTTFGQC